MLTDKIETISRAPLASLDGIARATWATFAAGAISEAEATQIAEAIERRRAALRKHVNYLKQGAARRRHRLRHRT